LFVSLVSMRAQPVAFRSVLLTKFWYVLVVPFDQAQAAALDVFR
jgi:hypothetical protein